MCPPWVVQNEQQTWQSFPKEKCKLLQDATKPELECSLLGSKKQNGLNDPKCSHWKPTNIIIYSFLEIGKAERERERERVRINKGEKEYKEQIKERKNKKEANILMETHSLMELSPS
jgi:hypothetical protein